MKKLKQGVYSKGYNSFDHPIELKEQEAQTFQNLYPREGISAQREGTSFLDNVRTNLFDVLGGPPTLRDQEEQGMIIFDCVGTRYWVHFFNKFLVYYKNDKVLKILPYPNSGNYKDSIVVDNTLIIQTDVERSIVYPIDSLGRPNKTTQVELEIKWVETSRRQSYWVCTSPDRNKNGQQFSPTDQYYLTQDSSDPYTTDTMSFENLDEADTRMWAYYLITYIRRTDADAMDANGDSLETTVFSNGLYETAADFEKDTRVIYKRKGPVNSSNVTYARSGTSGVLGNYVYWLGDGRIFKITDATYDSNKVYTSVDPDSGDEVEYRIGCTEVSYSDEHSIPNITVSYPKKSAMSLLPPGLSGELDFTTGTPVFEEEGQGYTHVRIYRTLFSPTQAEAKGSSFRFLVDRPLDLSDNSVYVDTTSDAELTGSLHTYNKFGAQPTPQGKMSYVNGKLWTCPSLLSDEDGRAYYSDGIYSPIDQLANLWHSQTATNWVTIDSNGTDRVRAVVPENQDVALLGDNSVWYIQDGDPSIAGPQRASSDLGIVGHRAWSSSEYGIFYLSKRGPALFANKQVRIITEHKAGELYPKQGSFSLNDKNNTLEVDWSNCISYLTHTAWMIYNKLDSGTQHIGFMLNNQGCFTVQHDDHVSINQLAFSKDREVFGTIGNNDIGSFNRTCLPIKMFDAKSDLDLGEPFTCIARSKDYFGSYDRNGVPERGHATDMFNVTFYNRFAGVGDLTIRTYLDENLPIQNVYGYDFESDPSHDYSNGLVMNTECIFREGALANRFSIEWERKSVGRTDVLGFDLGYNVYKNTSPSYSVTEQSVLNLLPQSPTNGIMVIDGGTNGGFQVG